MGAKEDSEKKSALENLGTRKRWGKKLNEFLEENLREHLPSSKIGGERKF